jgi:hypothetical protein
MARAVFRPKVEPVPEFDPEDFDLPDTIQGWLETDFDQEVRDCDSQSIRTLTLTPAGGRAGFPLTLTLTLT